MNDPNDIPEALIDRLVADLRPVRVESARRLAPQFGLALALPAALFLALLEPQPHALELVFSAHFAFSLVVLALGVGLGTVLLASWSRPGRAAPRKLSLAFAAALAAALVVQLVRLAGGVGIETAAMRGWTCAALSVVMSAVAGALAFVLLRRQAPVRPVRTGLMALLSAWAVAGIVLQLHCADGSPLHVVLWHLVAPGALLSVLSVPASRIALRW